MQFVDECTIKVGSGNGGNGIVAFRRERNVPLGGPSGGDGGNGGSVILVASRDVDTLLPMARSQRYVAKNGGAGEGNNRHGASAADVRVMVPEGTVVFEGERQVADLLHDGDEIVIVRGGKGGYGNRHYVSAVNQSPREFTYGEEGVERNIRLELKLIADVGLVGFPNAGKSTLLSRLSAARPKIADYPFTTMQPQLGIVSDGYAHELIMADIPGIIEGAAGGAGMGFEFLRHVERCRLLLHLVNLVPIDGSYSLDNFHAINRELMEFSPVLAAKPQLVVGNKLDLTAADESLDWLREELDVPVLGISAVTGEGLKELGIELFKMLAKHPREGSK